jgi:predicted transcriptional regulator of viral defense system
MKNLTYSINKLPQTIFTTREIAIILSETNPDIVKSKINYYVKRGELFSIKRGIYSKDETFNECELATKLYTPSYVSFETILARHGIVFQYDSRVHCASYVTRELKVKDVKIYYKSIKREILSNPMGIIYTNYYPEATAERAFLDTIYVFGKRHFDNLSPIDFEKCQNMLSVYEGTITKKDLKKYARYY